ncbi:acyl transferase/acyl hydrolase/lysophospholipase [Rhypophila decipiens]|uniref:Acyl transferase/acyl hydrolase/lysophospholipase n=1 Tax=Rhypophila decipiens TaxID=261697 RepID=A0AAN6XYY3_9PEZI|nr:acyl transferase/acyl hydrolase/lysophospholipase [Rhypophila decipiens]
MVRSSQSCLSINKRVSARQDTDCKTFVVALMYKDEQPRRFRTYDSEDGEAPNCTIWGACRATSAAPIYFPPIQIAGHTYCDGGAKANNPISEIYHEARREQPGRAIRSIVSLGPEDQSNSILETMLGPLQNMPSI